MFGSDRSADPLRSEESQLYAQELSRGVTQQLGADESVSVMRRRLRILAGVLIGLTALHSLAALLIRPSMFSDSGWGFLVLQSMMDGAPFNNLVSPDPLDLASDNRQFVTWWSPAQYLVPGLFETLGATLGVAMVLTSCIFSALGALGWCQLYKSAGFPFKTIAISTLAIVTTRWFALPFGIYNGGEVLLFGVTPWMALLFWRLRSLPALAVPALTGAMLLLAAAKLTGVIVGYALLGSCLLFGGDRRAPRRWLVTIGVATLFGSVFLTEWLARGATPGLTREASWLPSLFIVLFPVGGAIGSTLGFGDLLSWSLLHPARPVVTSLCPLYLALALPIALLIGFVWRQLRTIALEYSRFALGAAVLFSFAFVLLSSRGGISFEERHFRSVGLMLIVGFVQVFSHHRSKLVRGTFYSVLLGMAAFGLGSSIAHARHNLGVPLGVHGFRHHIASPALLNFIAQTFGHEDRRASDTVVYVPSPEIGLEVRNSRVLAGQPDFDSIEALARRKYRGRVRSMYVVLQKDMVKSGKAEVVLRSFQDYELAAWKEIDLGDFVCYFQR